MAKKIKKNYTRTALILKAKTVFFSCNQSI